MTVTPTPTSTPTSTPISTPISKPTSTPTSIPLLDIVNNSVITLSNGVILHKPLNKHAAWAKVANAKLGLGMIGIGLIDIITTLCLKDISSICPDYTMPTVQLPNDVLALDVSMDVLKTVYKPYAEMYCNIPLADWKIIKAEITPYLDNNIM